MTVRNEINDDGSMSLTTLDRFNDRWSLNANYCWVWSGHRTDEGYGVLVVGRRRRPAHRISYEHFYGPVGDGLVIDHLCRNRACVNPDHLEAVPNEVNVARGIGLTAQQSRQTHCKRGHEFSESNTRVSPTGRRQCRTCDREKQARYAAARRTA
jgi:hypothetical protein